MPNQDDFLKALRDEAAEMKSCFTRYSFQTISISLIALGIVARTQKDFPQMGLVSALIILLVLAVLRIGIYKYYGANRIYGFELHVARINHLNEDASDIPLEKLTEIPWEEAMRAWRIVQPTIFRAIYDVKARRVIRLFAAIPRLKPEFRNGKNLWFRIKTLITEDTVYYSGSYLRTMFSILYIIVFLAFLSMAYMSYQVLTIDGVSNLMTAFGVILPFFVTVLAIQRLRQMTIRRHILEDGLHSIHSCAITWHLVTVAHFRALRQLGGNGDDFKVDTLTGYTATLSEIAKSMLPNLAYGESIYDWLDNRAII